MSEQASPIGISDNRIHHMLSVARKCYSLGKEKYKLTEEESRECFVMGLLHDFGYEFSTSMSEHPKVGADILENMKEENLEKMIDAIRHHGNCNNINCTVFDLILNEADMSVDSKGNNVSMQERLKDIGRRYGTDSRQYLNAEKMIEKLKKNNYT